MSLWLCVRFPRLPLDCLSKEESRPVVVLERQRVVAANDEALATGVSCGQSASTVRALIADDTLILLERDRTQEQRALQRLLHWAYSITPTLEAWQDNALQLEVGSCLRLYGSIEPLIAQLQRAMAHRGFVTRFALAPNRIAAGLLSLQESDTAIDANPSLTTRLGPLPLSLIPCDNGGDFQRVITSLERAGIHSIDDLLALPSAAIGRRCGKPFQQWLARAIASSDDVTQDYHPPATFYDALWFGFEIRHTAELKPAMVQLLEGFCQFLRNTQLSTGVITWQLLRMRGDPESFTVTSSEAHTNSSIWLELSCLRLERLTIGNDIEGLALDVNQLTSDQVRPSDLFNQSHTAEPLHSLLDRLRGRLGLQAVRQLGLREAHLPEHSQYLSQDSSDSVIEYRHSGQRPFWLFAEPQPVHQEQERLFWNGPLDVIYGPERIEDNWWQQPVSRDYYVARSTSGQPLWLFQDRRNRRWYVQGVLP